MRFYKAKKPPNKRMHRTAPVGARVSAVLLQLRWVWWRGRFCILRRGGLCAARYAATAERIFFSIGRCSR